MIITHNDPWFTFWQKEGRSFFDVMQVATNHFARQLEKRNLVSKGLRLLDYGCGPGFLLTALKDLGVDAVGVDVNPFFVDEACNSGKAFEVHLISADLEQTRKTLERISGGKHFDIIVVLSVIQYLPDMHSVEKMMTMLTRFLTPQGKIILADVIDENTSSIGDAAAVAWQCMRRGKLYSFLIFFLYLMSSDYARISKKRKLLNVNLPDIKAIADNLNLECEQIKDLTLHPTRMTYIFESMSNA